MWGFVVYAVARLAERVGEEIDISRVRGERRDVSYRDPPGIQIPSNHRQSCRGGRRVRQL